MKELLIGAVIVFVLIVGVVLVAPYNDTIGLTCRTACAHIDGAPYVDCVLQCKDAARGK